MATSRSWPPRIDHADLPKFVEFTKKQITDSMKKIVLKKAA